ncbi:hypothetical protein J8C06_04210 [Chloracidobacterium validum]|uniref:Glycosyltransferase RgtA/B/C/D-like domain-containing protein n=1 Tax=Chloracidobacterium validum TaxID=2821543 RepID=A0ABX8BB64_9BACT|nr:hypothetical protein [Chloracidobacterium validum]QUW03647.1 hypothetical protein J8C06_04210 [Chloracidobacterium validum]
MSSRSTADVKPTPWPPALLLVLFVWAIAILPSALPRPWAALDDWRLWDMATSHGFVDVALSRNDGERYRPVFWLYYAAMANGLGMSRAAHHIVQALALLGFGGGYLLLLARRMNAPAWLGWSLPAVLFIQSPLAENAYTLGKADWMVALGLLGAITAGLFALTQPHRLPWWMGWASLCAGGAILCKESGLVALGTLSLIGIAGYVAQSWKVRGLLSWHLAAGLLFLGAYWLPSKYLIQPTTYRLTLADLSLRGMAFNGYTYATKYPELALLGAATLIGLALEWEKARRRDPIWLLGATAWLSGGAALGLLIVWKWPCGYFLMPVNACWLAALLLTGEAFGKLARPWQTVAAGVGSLWLALNVVGFAQTARLQRACWQGFGMFTQTYAQTGAPDSRLFFPENITEEEVPIEVNNQVKHVYGGRRLGALPGAGALALGQDPKPDELRQPTAGDYLALRRYAHAFGKHVRLFEDCATVNLLPRLANLGWKLTPMGTYDFGMPNLIPGRDVGQRVVMEHALYRLEAAPPVRFALNGGLWRTDDWTGPELTLLVHQPGRFVIAGELPAAMPAPVRLRCLVDGRPTHEQTLQPGAALRWEVTVPVIQPRQAIELRLVADQAVAAEQIGLRPKQDRLSWRLRQMTFTPLKDD